MKILVTYAADSSESKIKTFLEGVNYLKKLGHNVTVDTTSGKSSDKAAKRTEKLIRDTDIVLIEASAPDLKIGFDVARALSEKKIVLALSQSGKNDAFDYVQKNKFKNLISMDYDAKNINQVVDKALDLAKKMMDTKFILIISPEIDRYLDWASQTKRMHKAQIVRNSIESMIRKDKDYKNYLVG